MEGAYHKAPLQGTRMGKGDVLAFVGLNSHKQEIDINCSGSAGDVPLSPQRKFNFCGYIKNFVWIKWWGGKLKNLIVKVRLSVVIDSFGGIDATFCNKLKKLGEMFLCQ